MRKLTLLACAVASVAALTLSTGASGQTTGVLSIDQGRGVVILELRGVVLGRLTSGTLRVTDQTPRDRFEEIVNGKLSEPPEFIGPRTTVYRGQGLRFRMVGGRYRIVVRGTGIAVSAIGRGLVQLDGEPRVPGEPTGLYSINGTDCSLEPTLCTPLPEERESFDLGGVEEPPEPRSS